MTLTKALSLSLNTVAVRLGLEVGPKAVVAVAHRLGIASDLQPNASIALGTSEVSPLEMASGLRALRQWRARRAAAHHHAGQDGERRPALPAPQRGQRPGRRRAPRGDDEHDDDGDADCRAPRARPICRAGRRPARPARARIGATPGSSATPAASSPAYGSATTTSSPTKKASGGTLPVEIWSRFMKGALAGEAPSPLPLGLWRGAPDATYGAPGDDGGRWSGDAGPMAGMPPRGTWRDEQAGYGYRPEPADTPYRSPRPARRDDQVRRDDGAAAGRRSRRRRLCAPAGRALRREPFHVRSAVRRLAPPRRSGAPSAG